MSFLRVNKNKFAISITVFASTAALALYLSYNSKNQLVDDHNERPSTLKVDREIDTATIPQIEIPTDAASNSSRIARKPNSAWLAYSSPVGYSFQYPPSLGENGPNSELRDGTCNTYVSNNVGGVMSFNVVPYDGGSRRKLYFGKSTPNWTRINFEDIQVAGSNALIIYFGSEQSPEYGLGMAAVIPKGNAALIVNYPSRTNVLEWKMILGTIQINSSLDISKCNATYTSGR